MLLNFDDANPKQKICEADPELLATPIYRIYQIRHIVELFLNHRNSLFRPSIWDDPHEDPLMKATITIARQKGTLNVTKNFFGQCWSLHEESDDMWQIYSPNNCGVKVCTTIGKLHDSIQNKTKVDGEVFIGQIEYKKQPEILNILRRILNSTSRDESDLAFSFLFKDESFEFEKEIRLLFVPKINPVEDRFEYDFNPFDVFDQIMLDPRLDDCASDVIKKFFTTQGFEKKLIK